MILVRECKYQDEDGAKPLWNIAVLFGIYLRNPTPFPAGSPGILLAHR